MTEIDRCIKCGTCMQSCPVIIIEGSDEFKGPRSLAIDDVRFSGDVEVLWDSLLMCTTCWKCQEVCPSGIDLVDLILDMRGKLFSQDMMLPGHRRIVENIDQFNRAVEPGPVLTSDVVRQKADVAYFPGCISKERLSHIFNSTVSILDKTGVDFGVPDGWVCCGAPLEKIGDTARMKRLIEMNLSVLENFEEVVTSCPGCTTQIQNHYGIEPLHMIEFIREIIGIEKLSFRTMKKKVALHYPCHLARTIGSHTIDYAYEILQQIPGLEVVEMERPDMCCGGGGGIVAGFPEIGLDLAKEKIRLFEKSGADILLAPCPFCELNLKRTGWREVAEFITFVEGLLVP